MECDYYKLYLAIDATYVDKIVCQSLAQVDYELNRATGYDEYLVIGHNKEMNCDTPVAHGYIEINRVQKRKTK